MDARVLLLGATGASLCHLRGRQVLSMTPLGTEAGRPDRLLAALCPEPTLPVTLVLDLVEETFWPERLPPLAYRDRRELRARRLAAQFRDTSRRLQVPGASRLEVLFAGLGRPERLEPWLLALRNAGAPLRGIHSLPLVSAGFLPRLGLQRGAWLLLARTCTGGLRQSFFRDGHLLLSRLVPLPDGFDTAAERALAGEIAQMRRYLARHALLAPDTAMPLALLADPALKPAGELLAQDPDLRPLRLFSTLALARASGVPDALASQGIDALVAHLVVRRPPVAQYATALELLPYRRARWQAGLLRGAVLGLSAAAAGGALLTAEGFELSRRAEALAREAQAQRQALAELAAALPPALFAPAQMAHVLTLGERLAAETATPADWLTALAPEFEGAAGLRWTGLDWQDRDSTAEGEKPGPVAVWRGEVAPFDGDYRLVHARIEALATRLGQVAGVAAVTVLESPLGPDAGAVLVGQGAPGEAHAAPRFALRISFTRTLERGQVEGATHSARPAVTEVVRAD